jgi:hypothetical protein
MSRRVLGWCFLANLRRLTSGCRLRGPEVGGFASGRLRMLPEVFGFASGGFSEVSSGATGGEFLVVAIFTRRFCGVLGLPAPEDP